MKIRTITTGFNLDEHFTEEEFCILAIFTARTKALFEKHGYDVQTIRMSTQPWETYASTRSDFRHFVKKRNDGLQHIISIISILDQQRTLTLYHGSSK